MLFRRILFPAALACAAGTLPMTSPHVAAQSTTPTLSVLYTFDADDSHGRQSGKNLLKGSDGNFYGVMEQGVPTAMGTWSKSRRTGC